MYLYSMLAADSCVWLANNREVQTHIERLAWSAWDIKRKECHWGRHNGDHDRRPLSLPLRFDRVTLSVYNDLGQIKWMAGASKLRKGVRMWQHRLGMGKYITICLSPRMQEFGHTYHRNTTLGRRPRVILRCCVWINSRIRGGKQW